MPAVGYRLSLKAAKALFFDRQSVTERLDPFVRQRLSRLGYFTMRNARQRLRKQMSRSGRGRDDRGRFTAASGPLRSTPSRPGQSPTNQGGPLKPLILFSFENIRRSVVIGPARLNSRIASLEIPRTLEEGGMATITAGHARGKHYYLAPRPYMGPARDRAWQEHGAHTWKDRL